MLESSPMEMDHGVENIQFGQSFGAIFFRARAFPRGAIVSCRCLATCWKEARVCLWKKFCDVCDHAKCNHPEVKLRFGDQIAPRRVGDGAGMTCDAMEAVRVHVYCMCQDL